MNRLELISLVDYNWAIELYNFFESNQEFARFSHIAPMKKYPTMDLDNPEYPRNLFEHMIYYIASAGVRTDYGLKQFVFLSQLFRGNSWEFILNNLQIFLSNTYIQDKKRQVYWDLICWMCNNNLTNETITIDHIPLINISGVGPGFVANLMFFYSKDENYCEYTDRVFVKGFSKLYNISKPSKSVIVQTINRWTNKRIGNMMCFQIAHYG